MASPNPLNIIRKECDVIIKVADARDPSTIAHFFKSRKRTLIVFNKIDLCSQSCLHRLKERYPNAFFVSTRTRNGKGALIRKLKEIANREGRFIRIGVIGYPNVGKSSLINMLRGRRSARASATPGETKGVQWLKIADNIMMYDSPGVIPHRQSESRLIKTFAVSAQNASDPEGIAEDIISHLINRYGSNIIESAYDVVVESGDSPNKILEKIASRRNMLLKGGELDLDRAAKAVIMDWQKGKIFERWKGKS